MNDYREWRRLIESSFDQFVNTLGAYLPSLLGAVVLMVVGLIVAWLGKWVILRVGKGLDNLTNRAGLSAVARLRWPLSDIMAGIVYWLVILFFATAAAESLGLPGLADWLGNLIAYLPSVVAALLIIFAGYVVGGMARDRIIRAANSANLSHANFFGGMARAAVLILTVVIGLSQMGIEIRLIEHLLAIIAAAALFAFALAFGLGAGTSVANIIASRNIRRNYRVGQRIRVGDVEGEILELSTAFVLLDTEHGRSMIPAKAFDEEVTVLMDSRVPDED